MTDTTEITLVSGESYRISGNSEVVERVILDAARGSIMEFAWVVEAETGRRLGVNPTCVAMVREVDS